MNVWKQYVEHDFFKQLGKGTLSRESFVHFLKCVAVAVPYDPQPAHIHTGDHIHHEGRIISTSSITLEQMGTIATNKNTFSQTWSRADIPLFPTASLLLNPLYFPVLQLRQRRFSEL
jgi:hydroxymethylpyrimidine/phosphomethylpyrimidine kinase